MREVDRIARGLERAYDGEAWHGPSLRANLTDVGATQAAARPVPGAHSIGELVLHLTAWTREITRRLRDGVARDPDEGDWPELPTLDQGRWAAILTELDTANRKLIAAISELDDTTLSNRIRDARDGSEGVSRRATLQGLIQHHAYHSGQIALLKRALGG